MVESDITASLKQSSDPNILFVRSSVVYGIIKNAYKMEGIFFIYEAEFKRILEKMGEFLPQSSTTVQTSKGNVISLYDRMVSEFIELSKKADERLRKTTRMDAIETIVNSIQFLS